MALDTVALVLVEGTSLTEGIDARLSLVVDHFGLSIGPVSVGLPTACTADDVYRRYLDLIAVLQRGPVPYGRALEPDLDVLATATAAAPAFVARRLRALRGR